jgi:hypothetical protein
MLAPLISLPYPHPSLSLPLPPPRVTRRHRPQAVTARPHSLISGAPSSSTRHGQASPPPSRDHVLTGLPCPLFRSPPVPPGRHKSRRQPRSPFFPRFSSPSTPCTTASQLPTEHVCAIPQSHHCLTTRRPSHPWRRVSASPVSRSSMCRGSQVACASPSPIPSGTTGTRHRFHP